MRAGGQGAVVAAMLLLGGCAAQSNSCAVNPIAVINLTFDQSGLANLPASVNGVSASMLLDTGSETSVLSPALAAKAGVYLLNGGGQLLYAGVAGSGATAITAAKTFSVGGMTGQQVQFLVIPQKPGSGDDSIWGTLGIDIMSNYDIDLDYPDKTASLYDMTGCGSISFPWSGATAVIPLRFGANSDIYIPVTVNGRSFMALLDSGTSISSIPQGLFEQSGLAAQAQGPVGSSADHAIDNAGFTAQVYKFASITVGGVAMAEPYLQVLPPPAADDPRGAEIRFEARLAAKQTPDDLDLQNESGNLMIIGADFLREHRVYISYMTKQAYIPE